MLFKPKLCEAILEGRKTQTRRVVKLPPDGEVLCSWETGKPSYVWNGRVKWQIDRTYAVQPGRGKKAVGRIRIIAIRRERLQDIKTSDIVAEGVFPDESYLGSANRYRHPFVALWVSINTKKGTRWTDNPEVWVLEFELVT